MFDAIAEAKLRRKIDFMIVPTVSILYLFCFIDRANIGMLPKEQLPAFLASTWIFEGSQRDLGNARLAGISNMM